MLKPASKPAPSYAPVYAAAMYPDLVVIARKHGYALAVHGSLARDFDLIAIPWTDSPGTPDEVLNELAATFAVKRIGDWSDKPHGRRAFTLSVGFGQCAIDLQFMPTLAPKRLAEVEKNLVRIITEAEAMGASECPPKPHACPKCEILYVANEAIAILAELQVKADALAAALADQDRQPTERE